MGRTNPLSSKNQATARLLDANLNRAREGIRVVEDTARFVWNDSSLYRSLRRCRHQLHSLTASKYHDLISHRNTEQDPGKILVEGGRLQISDVVAANIRRAQEAVRVLEEYGKLFSSHTASDFKKVRYQLYILEKKIWKKHKRLAD